MSESTNKLFSGEVLRTDRLLLRWMETHDFSSLYAMFNDPIVMKYYPKMFNEEESRGWIERVLAGYQKYGHGFYIVENLKTGEFIGQIGLLPQMIEGNYQPELGYLIKSQCFGKGYATEAGKACLAYGFANLNVSKIISLIRPENLPSKAVATRLGLKPEREINWHGMKHVIHAISKDANNSYVEPR